MTLAYDIVVSAVIATIAAIIQLMALELFAPGATLHVYASTGTSVLNGAARADLWYEILALWLPIGGYVIAAAWPIVRAYRRQAVTAARPF